MKSFKKQEDTFRKHNSKAAKSNMSKDNPFSVKIPYDKNNPTMGVPSVDYVKAQFDQLEQKSRNDSVLSPHTETSSYYERSYPKEPKHVKFHQDLQDDNNSYPRMNRDQALRDPEFLLNSRKFY